MWLALHASPAPTICVTDWRGRRRFGSKLPEGREEFSRPSVVAGWFVLGDYQPAARWATIS
jgi:hypothetical protein